MSYKTCSACEQPLDSEALAVAREEAIAKLERQVLVAAGMLSATEGWSNKHPEEALEHIRKSAAEIDAKDAAHERDDEAESRS
jgi:hypothetical protein